jgi:hypothetical protein
MKVRINNIEAMPIKWIGDARPEKPWWKYELNIVKWYKNGYYGELDNYLKDGWKKKGKLIVSGNTSIHVDCFHSEELYYAIAFVKYDEGSQSTHLTSVADRLLYIEEDEKKDFFEVYKIADRMIIEKVDKDELADFGLKLP